MAGPVLDASTPAAATITPAATSTTTASFSPPASSLLVVFVSVQAASSLVAQSVTGITNSGTALAWNRGPHANHSGSAPGGAVEIWWAANASAQSGITVTASYAAPAGTGTDVNDGLVAVKVFTGAASSLAGAATATQINTTAGLPSASVTTTAANSWVWGVALNWSSSAIGTPTTGQAIVNSIADTTVGDSEWVQSQSAVTSASGTLVAISDTAPSAQTQLAVIEILAATGGGSGPSVTGISPSAGPTAGGTSVAITGTNFTAVSAVKFGATNAASFTVNSTSSITATSPAGSAGTVDITVVATAGTSPTSGADQFTYDAAPTVTGVSPGSGSSAGGTSVAITGTNFTPATAVDFGGSAAAFTVNSATSITATSPAGSGTVDITVVTPGGTSATSSADHFTYTAPPAPPPVAAGQPIVAVELQAVTASPFTPLTDSQWIYLAGSLSALNPTIAGQQSGRLRSATIQRGKQQALNRFEAGTLNAVLDNRDGALDPVNSASPFYPFVRAESRIRARAWYNRVMLEHALCSDPTKFLFVGATTASVTTSPTPRLTNTTQTPFASLRCTGNGTNGNLIAVSDIPSSNIPISPWDESKGYPVVAGETVTAIASYRATSAGRACKTTINFFNSAGANVGVGFAATSAGVTDTSSGWTDDSVSAVVPPASTGVAYAVVGHTIAAVASGEIHSISAVGFWGGNDTHVLAANLVPGQAATLGGAAKMAIDLFYGYIDGDTLDYRLGYDAYLTLTATDAFKRFNSFDARDYFAMLALSYKPLLYLRFNEASSSTLVFDSSGSGAVGSLAGLTLGVNVPENVGQLASSSNNCVTFNGTAGRVVMNTVVGGTFSLVNLLNGTQPLTFMAWVKTTYAGGAQTILGQGSGAGGQPSIEWTIAATGDPYIYYVDSSGTGHGPVSVSGTPCNDGNWHLLAVTIDASGNCVGYMDGAITGGGALGHAPAMTGPTGNGTMIGSTGYVANFFNGSMDEVVIIGAVLTASEISDLYAARTALFGTTAPAAVSALLSAAGWGLGYLDQTTGAYLVGALDDIDRSTLLDALNNKISLTDYGAFFIRPDGQACYFTGQWVAANSVLAATFSDVADSNYGWANIPYGLIQRQLDEQLVYNDWINTWHGDARAATPVGAETFEVTVPASIAIYGSQKQQQTLYSGADTLALGLTQWLAAHFATPSVRFPLIEVNLRAFPGAAPQVLGRELMDYVAVIQTPMGLAAMTFNPLIIHIEDTIAPSSWTRRFIADCLDAG